MQVNVKKELITATGGVKGWAKFGVTERSLQFAEHAKVQLGTLSLKRITALEAMLTEASQGTTTAARQAKNLVLDVRNWLTAVSNPSTVKPRSVAQFEGILKQYLLKVPGHRLFQRDDADQGTWWCYYVGKVGFTDGDKRRETRPHVTMTLYWEEHGLQVESYVTFYDDDCRNLLVGQALGKKGYFPETDDLRAAYHQDVKRYTEVHKAVGRQFWASGVATSQGVDGNGGDQQNERYGWGGDEVDMVRNGESSKVVMDVPFEVKERGGDKEKGPELWFWKNVRDGVAIPSDDDDDDDVVVGAEEFPVGDADDMEIPIHPTVTVFDLSKHLRIRMHVQQLADYHYDKHLADKLVLGDERKELVQLLVDTKAGGFTDIVRGKAGGAVVLLAGPPGTGKTLTAEVYAESEGRALYSVQCSQLGIDPDTLEAMLLKVFNRARRWNAVLLLDEADVYVRERSNDLMQNAIVGVFLRVLEYQSTVMFLTTNRPDDVDDAIASRCIAKLTYDKPTADQQARIWKVLLAAQKITVADDVIEAIVDTNRDLSGRDIKNLMKLAKLRGPITPESVKFVRQFKPTR